MNHPFQPIEIDSDLVQRFKKNFIIEELVLDGKLDVIDAAGRHSMKDVEQVRQLLGMSTSSVLECQGTSDALHNYVAQWEIGKRDVALYVVLYNTINDDTITVGGSSENADEILNLMSYLIKNYQVSYVRVIKLNGVILENVCGFQVSKQNPTENDISF